VIVYRDSAWNVLKLITPNGATFSEGMLEQLVTVSSGAYVDTTIAFPSRGIMLCAACRTVATVTGASAYNCGIVGDTSKFGGSIGVGAGSTNIGVIGPTAVYADTPVRLTAVTSNFTGGTIRVSISYLAFGAATS
jgi:hypothetical protein